MNRLREKISTHREEKHQRKQDALVGYVHNPDALRPIDTLRTDDAEILGDHARGLFRDPSRKKADKLVGKIEHAEDVKDTVTTREKYLEARSNFTQIRIDRLQTKISNSSDNMFTRRLNSWRREKLHDLKAKNKKRTGAISDVENKRQKKPELLQKKIDELVKKKIDAMYNKAQRKELQRNKIGKVNFVKRTEFMAKMTPEMKKKIMWEAILLARRKNVEKGRLNSDHVVDDTLEVRKVTDEYGRTIK